MNKFRHQMIRAQKYRSVELRSFPSFSFALPRHFIVECSAGWVRQSRQTSQAVVEQSIDFESRSE
jgi:hypothetical protein